MIEFQVYARSSKPGGTHFSEIIIEWKWRKKPPIWYAMRATYRREPDAMRLLEKEKLSCFVPMQYKISIKKGKKVVFWFLSFIIYFLFMLVLPR